MSRGLRPRLLTRSALAAAALALPVASAAQQTEEELLGRLEELRAPLAEAAAAASAERERRARARTLEDRAPTDTIHVGPFRIVTLPEQADLAEGLFREAWRTEYGSLPAAPGIEARTFTFQWGVRLRNIDPEPPSGSGPTVMRIELYRFVVPTREAVLTRITDAMGAALVQDLPTTAPLREWLGNARRTPAYEEVYRTLAVEPSGAHRACLAGEVAACRVALGLGIDDGGGLARWFTPEQRRQLVRSSHAAGSRDGPGGAARRCIEARDVTACDAVLLDGLDWTSEASLDRRARTSLLRYALSRGGEGAWARVRERVDAHPADALAHAAGVAETELLAGWRNAVVDHRPRAHAALGATGWAVLFWVMILASLAMRSTRWRLA